MTTPASLVLETGAAPAGSSLALLRLPFAFSQDRLLGSEDFVEEARSYGIELSLELLESLRLAGLIVPIFRVDDEEVSGRRLMPTSHLNWELTQYAVGGRLRDPAHEGFHHWWPIGAREYRDGTRWWDGYYFSPWQFLTLRTALADLSWARHEPLGEMRKRALANRREALVLSALSPRHLPGIVGTMSLERRELSEFEQSAATIGDYERLNLVGVDPRSLRDAAEYHLSNAHGDPLIEWWPLIRHSDHRGWLKLKGASAFALKQRVAAEILLRSHEHLAEVGHLEPLPTYGPDDHWWHPLRDRITVRDGSAETLDQALGSLGLSPYPRVLLVVEGKTEELHITRLLEEFGIANQDRVRLLNQETSNRSPRDLARYVTAPRIAGERFDRARVNGTPTALVIAMDPENLWATEEGRRVELGKLHEAVRMEVEAQGAQIDDDELNVLVRVEVWDEVSYELANFSDHELEQAITDLAHEEGVEAATAAEWPATVIAQLQQARSKKDDIKHVLLALRIPVRKVRLAQLLLPRLLEKLEKEAASSGPYATPVIRLIHEVRLLVGQLSGAGFTLATRPSMEGTSSGVPRHRG